MAKMRAARMYGYKQSLKLEEIPIPDIEPAEILVKVGGAGMCRTDFQLIDGYFQSNLPLEFPVTPGHEIAGTVVAVGSDVPAAAGLSEVIALAEAGKIKDSLTEVRFEDVNDHIDALARGDFVGRAVIVYD